MKKIGLIDYYISEWHANHYPGWIREYCARKGLDYEVAYAFAELDVSKVDGKTTAQWCAEMNIQSCRSIEELCQKSDFVIILAPSDPDKHLAYTKEAFRCAQGKRMYIDKTFAPDHVTAGSIFDEAEKYGVEMFSTSALRYAEEIKAYSGVRSAETFGGGSNYEEYIIHQIEMIVKMMGVGAEKVKVYSENDALVTEVVYRDGRVARMNYEKSLKFKTVVDNGTEREEKVIVSDYFRVLMEKIISFFNGEKSDFPSYETLEVMKIREAAIKARADKNVWKSIP